MAKGDFRGSLGHFRDPPVISLGCFGGGKKQKTNIPDRPRYVSLFPFRGIEYWIEETRRVVTFSPSYVRNTAERRRILRSFFRCSNVSTPELRDVEIYNSTGDAGDVSADVY